MSETRTFQPGLACWFCDTTLREKDLLRNGILRARAEREGGPYRLLLCDACEHVNLCERTPKGRWFSSPTFEPRLIDFVVGRVFPDRADEFLQAVTWLDRNEDRRRYFFERDGDRRYSRGGVLRKLWSALLPSSARADASVGAHDASARRERRADREARAERVRRERERRDREEAWRRFARERAKAREKHDAGGGDAGHEHAGRDGARGGRDGARGSSSRPGDERTRPRGPEPTSPWAILGVRPGADEAEIHRAFRRLARRYHPDKVHHLGEEFQRVATRKFQELQRAYESISRRASEE